jgi:hypothetical protein
MRTINSPHKPQRKSTEFKLKETKELILAELKNLPYELTLLF